MRYAVIAVSSIEQQYKGIKTKMKNEGKDVTEMNAEMKEAAIRLLENLAAIDEYSLTDQDKASLGDIVEAVLEMFITRTEKRLRDTSNTPRLSRERLHLRDVPCVRERLVLNKHCTRCLGLHCDGRNRSEAACILSYRNR